MTFSLKFYRRKKDNDIIIQMIGDPTFNEKQYRYSNGNFILLSDIFGDENDPKVKVTSFNDYELIREFKDLNIEKSIFTLLGEEKIYLEFFNKMFDVKEDNQNDETASLLNDDKFDKLLRRITNNEIQKSFNDLANSELKRKADEAAEAKRKADEAAANKKGYYLCRGGVVLEIDARGARKVVGKITVDKENLVFDPNISDEFKSHQYLPDSLLNRVEIPNFALSISIQSIKFRTLKGMSVPKHLSDLSTVLPAHIIEPNFNNIAQVVETSEYCKPIEGHFCYFETGVVGFASSEVGIKQLFDIEPLNHKKYFNVGTWDYDHDNRCFNITYDSNQNLGDTNIELTDGARNSTEKSIKFAGAVAKQTSIFGVKSQVIDDVKKHEAVQNILDKRTKQSAQMNKLYPKNPNDIDVNRFIANMCAAGWHVRLAPNQKASDGKYLLTEPVNFKNPRTFEYYPNRGTIGIPSYVDLTAPANEDYIEKAAKLVDLLPPKSGMKDKEMIYRVYVPEQMKVPGAKIEAAIKNELGQGDYIVKTMHDYDQFTNQQSAMKRSAPNSAQPDPSKSHKSSP